MTVPEPTAVPTDLPTAAPPLWWSPSRGLIERFGEGAGAYYQSRGHGAGQLPADAVHLAPYRIRSYWTGQHTWTDPDCFECGGEGAPCCDPPDYPWPGEATDLNELDRLRAGQAALLAECADRFALFNGAEWIPTSSVRALLGVTDA